MSAPLTIHLAGLVRSVRRVGSLWVALLGSGLAAAEAELPGNTIRDNVVIVLDASGSMSGRMPRGGPTKMEAAKSALKAVLQRLPPDIQVGFLVFSGSNIPGEWVYPLGPRDDARLLRAIDLPQPGGGTPLGAYIKKGADRLLQERERQFSYGSFRLLIVTDGEAQDQALVERYAPEIMARGITVDVIGVAMDQRHTLATRVHSYRAANDPQALERAVAEVFAEVRATTQDSAGAEVFADLEPLPTEVALAAIQALTTSGNQPIGERPTIPRAAPQDARATASPAPSSQAAPSTPSPQPDPGPQSQSRPKILIVLGSLACCGLLGLILLVVLIKAMKRSRRRP